MKVVERDIYIPVNRICNWPGLKMREKIIAKKEWLRAPCCSQRTLGKTKPPAEAEQELFCAFLQHTCQRNTQPSSCQAFETCNRLHAKHWVISIVSPDEVQQLTIGSRRLCCNKCCICPKAESDWPTRALAAWTHPAKVSEMNACCE